MTCASCGRQVATGARYCIHCGAEQSVPTPIAAVAAASMARRGAREAANAAHADPASTRSNDADRMREAPVAPFGHDGVARAANSDQPTRPAYADAPRRRGLATAVVTCLGVVAVAVAAAVAWRLTGEQHTVTTAAKATSVPASTQSTAAPAVPLSEAPAAGTVTTSTSATTAATTPAASESPSPPEAVPPAEPAASTVADHANAPVEIKSLPPHPASTSRPAHRPPTTQPTPTATETAKAPEPASETAQPKVAQAPPPVHRAAAPATSRVVDRWRRFDDELSQCTREDFITRVICGQRVRFRYCDGYWGKVPQCPGNPGTERGQ